MPKLDLKIIQRELEKGVVWPFYWLYGQEKMKSRELIKRIRKAVLGEDISQSGRLSWNEEVVEGVGCESSVILDSARSPSLEVGVKLIVVKDAHALKNIEILSELFGPPQEKAQWASVCVCVSKDLDGRKKFSKSLIENAAVVPCEDVEEAQREAWIQYLSKRRSLDLSPALVLKLSSLEPWSLDIVDQELEKYLIGDSLSDVILEGASQSFGSEFFLEGFFTRNRALALPCVAEFAEHPDEALPLLGLLGWNVRQLALWISDRDNGTRHAKTNTYVLERLRQWNTYWKISELVELQEHLTEVDYSLKQTPLLPLGLWSQLVIRFCK